MLGGKLQILRTRPDGLSAIVDGAGVVCFRQHTPPASLRMRSPGLHCLPENFVVFQLVRAQLIFVRKLAQADSQLEIQAVAGEATTFVSLASEIGLLFHSATLQQGREQKALSVTGIGHDPLGDAGSIYHMSDSRH